MISISTEPLMYALLPPVLLVMSGALAAAYPPKPWLRGGILHLAAGVVFAVVSVELIPDLLRDHRPVETIIGFALGVAAMLGLRSMTKAKEKHEEEKQDSPAQSSSEPVSLPVGMLGGVAIDLIVDGFMIGIGFAAGMKEGRLLAIALAVELVSLGLAVAASLSKLGVRRTRTVKVLAGLSTTFLMGALIGTMLLSRLPAHYMASVVAFGAAALMFLVTEELLTEAHEEKESPALTAMFFVGFLIFIILGMMA